MYEDAMKFQTVLATVHVETNPDANEYSKETDCISEMARDKTNILEGLIASVDYGSPRLPMQVNHFINQPKHRAVYKGVRDCGHTQPRGYLATPQAVSNYQFLGSEGLVVELISRPEDLDLLIPVAKACQDTTFVLDHCGGIQGLKGDVAKENKWAKNMYELAKVGNVVCKISGQVGGWGNDERIDADGWSFDMQEHLIRHCLNCFHSNSLIFGSDWPMCNIIKGASLDAYIEGVRRVAYEVHGDRLVNQLFYKNATQMFGMQIRGEQGNKYDVRETKPRYVSQSPIRHDWKETSTEWEGKSFMDVYWDQRATKGYRLGVN